LETKAVKALSIQPNLFAAFLQMSADKNNSAANERESKKIW